MAVKKGTGSKKTTTTKKPNITDTPYDRWSSGAGAIGKAGQPFKYALKSNKGK